MLLKALTRAISTGNQNQVHTKEPPFEPISDVATDESSCLHGIHIGLAYDVPLLHVPHRHGL